MTHRLLAASIMSIVVLFRGCVSGDSSLQTVENDTRLEAMNISPEIETVPGATGEIGTKDNVFGELGTMDVFGKLEVMDLSFNLGTMQDRLSDNTTWIYNKNAFLYASGQLCGIRGLDIDREREGYQEDTGHRYDMVGNRITKNLIQQAALKESEFSRDYLSYFNYYDEVTGEYITKAAVESKSRFACQEPLLAGNVLKITLRMDVQFTLEEGVTLPEELESKVEKITDEEIKITLDESIAETGTAQESSALSAEGEKKKRIRKRVTLKPEAADIYYYLDTGTPITIQKYESLLNEWKGGEIYQVTVTPGDGSSQLCQIDVEANEEMSASLNRQILEQSEKFRKLSQNGNDYDENGICDELVEQYHVDGYTEDGYQMYGADVGIYKRYLKEAGRFDYMSHALSQYNRYVSILGYYSQNTYYYVTLDIDYYTEDEETLETLKKLPLPLRGAVTDISYIKAVHEYEILKAQNQEDEESVTSEFEHHPMKDSYIYQGYRMDREYTLNQRNDEEPVLSQQEDGKTWCQLTDTSIPMNGTMILKDEEDSTGRFYTITLDLKSQKAVCLEETVGGTEIAPRIIQSINTGFVMGAKEYLEKNYSAVEPLAELDEETWFADILEQREGEELTDDEMEEIMRSISTGLRGEEDQAERTADGPVESTAEGPGKSGAQATASDASDKTAEPSDVSGGIDSEKLRIELVQFDENIYQWFVRNKGERYDGIFSYKDVLYAPMSSYYESPVLDESGYVLFLDVRCQDKDYQTVIRIPYTDEER